MKSQKTINNTWRQMKMETQCSTVCGTQQKQVRKQEKLHITNLNLPLEELAKNKQNPKLVEGNNKRLE